MANSKLVTTMENKTLLEIIQICNLKKTDKHTSHSYIPHLYESLFCDYKDNKNNILEIGVREGDSLILWGKYFSKSKIYGIENYQDVVFNGQLERSYDHINSKKIKIYINDAYDENFVKSLPNFNIIIDDGPHTLEHQLKSIDLYLPKLRENGIFIIEDIQSESNLENLYNHVPDQYKRRTKKIDLRHMKGSHDDLVLLVWK